MTLAILIFSGKVPVWKDKLNICVIGFMIDVITLLLSLKSMSSQSVDVLLLQPFTRTSHSSIGERNIRFLFLEIKYSHTDVVVSINMLFAKSGQIVVKKIFISYLCFLTTLLPSTMK